MSRIHILFAISILYVISTFAAASTPPYMGYVCHLATYGDASNTPLLKMPGRRNIQIKNLVNDDVVNVLSQKEEWSEVEIQLVSSLGDTWYLKGWVLREYVCPKSSFLRGKL